MNQEITNFSKIFDNKNIIVVGPSPHLENKSQGEFIDSFDLVIRINEIVSGDLSIDYGTRNDIVFLSIPDSSIKYYKDLFKKNNSALSKVNYFISPRHSLHVTPYHLGEFNLKKNIFKNFEKLNLEKPLMHIGDNENEKLEKEIGTHPTTGTLTLSFLSKFNFKSLHVVGFSFYTTKKRYHVSRGVLANNLIQSDINTKLPGHDIKKELDFLHALFKDNKKVKGDNWFYELVIKGNYRVKNRQIISPFKLQLFG